MANNALTKMNWKIWTALLLLAPIYWWLICTAPPVGAIPFTMHMVEKGEHCNSFCEHLASDADPLLKASPFDVLPEAVRSDLPWLIRLPLDSIVRDRPPPWCGSFQHSLRAPPALTLA